MHARRRTLARFSCLAVSVACYSIAVRAQLPKAAAGSAQPSAGAISGVVTDGTSAEPLEGAVVTLFNIGGLSANGRALPKVTDSKGRFVFDGLSASSDYRVLASRLGYFDGAFKQGGMDSELGSKIALGAREWRNNIAIELQRPAAVRGTVVDDLDIPLVRTKVLAIRRLVIGDSSRFIIGPSAETDDRGEFRVGQLAGGSYLLLVQPQQYAPSLSSESTDAGPRQLRGYAWTYYPGVNTSADALALTIIPGVESSPVRIQLRATALHSISGRIQTVNGIAEPDAVRLVGDGDAPLGSLAFQATAAVENGNFEFAGVPSGHYFIVAQSTVAEYRSQPSAVSSVAPGLMVSSVGPSDFRSISLFSSPAQEISFTERGQGTRVWGRADVALDSDIHNVVVRMELTPRMEGTIDWDQGTPGRLNAASTLIAEPADGDVSLGAPQAQVLDGGTRFRIDGLMSGKYLLRFSNAKALIKSIRWQGREYADDPFDASTKADFSGVAVTLTTAGAKIAGMVQSRKGPVPPGISVVYFPVRQEWRHGFGLRSPRIGAATVVGGKYEIANVPAGDYYVVAAQLDRNDSFLASEILDGLISRAILVRVGWAGQVTQDLEWSIVGSGE